MKHRLLHVYLCALLWCLGSASASAWTLVKHDNQEFVTLEDFCKFYKLPFQKPKDEPFFRVNTKRIQIEFIRNSRKCKINGVRYWLCFPVVEKSTGHWLVSRIDLVKTFEPVFRPHLIRPRQTVKGVVIDPGHGGQDLGARTKTGKRVLEKNLALDTSLRLSKALQALNIRSVLIRKTDVFVPLRERAARASRYKDHIFVSIHYNSATRAGASGLETFAMTPRGAPSRSAGSRLRRRDYKRWKGNANDAKNTLLAHCIQRQIVKLNPGKPDMDRGFKRARFLVLKDNVLPAALVECGFLSNPAEAARCATPAYREQMAEAIALGVVHFVERVKPRRPTKPTPPPEPESEPQTEVASTPQFRGGAQLRQQENDNQSPPPSPPSATSPPASTEVTQTARNTTPPTSTANTSTASEKPTTKPSNAPTLVLQPPPLRKKKEKPDDEDTKAPPKVYIFGQD